MSLTPDQRRYIVALRETGMSVAGIAKRFGITRRTVYLWTRRYEKEGNVNRQQTQPRKRATTEALDAEIRAAIAAEPGLDTRQMALKFNVSMATIRQRLYGDRKRPKVDKEKEESYDINAHTQLLKVDLASTSERSAEAETQQCLVKDEEQNVGATDSDDDIKHEMEHERTMGEDSSEEVPNRFLKVEVKMEKAHDWQPGICRCCLSQGDFESMEREHSWADQSDSYTNILKTVLGLTLARVRGVSRICSACVDQLLQALAFQRRVVESERVFLLRNSTELIDESVEVQEQSDTAKPVSNIVVSSQAESDGANWSSDDDIPFNTIPPAKPKRLHRSCKSNETRSVSSTVAPTSSALAELVPAIRAFECKVCKEKFETYRMKYHHTKEAHGSQCKICYKRFLNMKEHLADHEASVVRCDTCEMTFYKPSELTNHKRTVHNIQKAASCPLCEYVAFDHTCLKKHMVCHSSDKNYECRHCGKKFARRTGLRNHERLHTGEKQYVCELCGEAFTQCTSLKYHMQKRHAEDRR